MHNLLVSIMEVIVLLLTVRLLMPRGYFSPDPYVSDPSIAAAIGNAANRKFENSQCILGGGCMTSRGYYGQQLDQPAPYVPGGMTNPEQFVYTGGYVQ